MATPNIDAAILAYLKQCPDRSFSVVNIEWARAIVAAALRAAIPKEPPAEVVEAMARAATGLAAYKAQPIYRELWS